MMSKIFKLLVIALLVTSLNGLPLLENEKIEKSPSVVQDLSNAPSKAVDEKETGEPANHSDTSENASEGTELSRQARSVGTTEKDNSESDSSSSEEKSNEEKDRSKRSPDHQHGHGKVQKVAPIKPVKQSDKSNANNKQRKVRDTKENNGIPLSSAAPLKEYYAHGEGVVYDGRKLVVRETNVPVAEKSKSDQENQQLNAESPNILALSSAAPEALSSTKNKRKIRDLTENDYVPASSLQKESKDKLVSTTENALDVQKQ